MIFILWFLVCFIGIFFNFGWGYYGFFLFCVICFIVVGSSYLYIIVFILGFIVMFFLVMIFCYVKIYFVIKWSRKWVFEYNVRSLVIVMIVENKEKLKKEVGILFEILIINFIVVINCLDCLYVDYIWIE